MKKIISTLLISFLLIGCSAGSKIEDSTTSEDTVAKVETRTTGSLEQKAYCVSNEYKKAAVDYINRDSLLVEVSAVYDYSFYGVGEDTCYTVACGGVDQEWSVQCYVVDIFKPDWYQVFIKNSYEPIPQNKKKFLEIVEGLSNGSYSSLDAVREKYGSHIAPI